MDDSSTKNISYQNISDEELIEMSIKKDQNSYKELVSRYLRPISVFIKGYIKDNDKIEDIIQDIFLKVWKNLSKFKPNNKFKPWLYKIARNTILDQLKKKDTLAFSLINEDDTNFDKIDNLIYEEPNIEDILDNSELLKQLKINIEKINPEYRTVLILHYEEELTFEEIGLIMDRPMNTVKSWHRRAINELRISFE